MYIIYTDENLRALRFKSSYVLLKCPAAPQYTRGFGEVISGGKDDYILIWYVQIDRMINQDLSKGFWNMCNI